MVTALLATLLVSALGSAPAEAAKVESFKPVRKTNRALFFKPRAIPVRSIRRAKVTLRFKGRRVGSRKVSAKRVRRAVRTGKQLRVRHQPLRGGKRKGGRLKVELAPRGGSEDIAHGGSYAVPSWVPSGCIRDATSQIRAWMATVPDGSTLRFDANGCYRIEGTLLLKGRRLAIDGNGSTFKSLNASSGKRALWRVWNSTVFFRDMSLIGSYANGGVHTPELQWAHGIELRGSHGIIENVSMSDLAGDCVYFGLGEWRSSGAVRDSSCRRTGRNGVSVVAGNDIRVERVTTDKIGYIAFDVEPNKGPGNGASRVVFDSNTIGSYRMKAYAVLGNAPITDQAFTNNTIVGGKGLKIGVVNRAHRPTRLRINDNRSYVAAAPPAMNLDGIPHLRVHRNAVRLLGGTMAQVRFSCRVSVSGNTYPGGSAEASITEPRC